MGRPIRIHGRDEGVFKINKTLGHNRNQQLQANGTFQVSYNGRSGGTKIHYDTQTLNKSISPLKFFIFFFDIFSSIGVVF